MFGASSAAMRMFKFWLLPFSELFSDLDVFDYDTSNMMDIWFL